MIPNVAARLQAAAEKDFTLFGLRFLLVGSGLAIILAAISSQNKWFLAGLGAYIWLP